MKRSSKIFLVLGCLLIISSLALLFVMNNHAKKAQLHSREIVEIMEKILPDRRKGAVDIERSEKMPSLELEGEDYIALLEIPYMGMKLPVSRSWGKSKVISNPCRFDGTAYDGTLIIGGYDQQGQFDFFDRISDGAEVMVTDMTGCVFTYEISRIERTSDVSAKNLADTGADLTLFVRDAQLLEYILLRCTAK